MRIKLPGLYPLLGRVNTQHWEREGTHHGPKSMPKVAAISAVRLNRDNPSFMGLRVWFYFRGGYAFYIEAMADRRELRK